MNKRCIVNVATGDFYCKMQYRLMSSFQRVTDFTIRKYHDKPFNKYSNKPLFRGESENVRSISKGIDLLIFRDCLPEGSRPHSESPYGFKIHAVKAAYEMGYTSILWIDSPAYAVKEDISPIFDKIENEGYYAMSHIDPLEKYVGDFVLNEYGFDRDYLVGKNLPSGTCYGFDLKGKGFHIFMSLSEDERLGLFRNEVNGEIVHRHDEACLALSLLDFNYPVFTFDPLFQSPSPECVIRSGEMIDLTPNV